MVRDVLRMRWMEPSGRVTAMNVSEAKIYLKVPFATTETCIEEFNVIY